MDIRCLARDGSLGVVESLNRLCGDSLGLVSYSSVLGVAVDLRHFAGRRDVGCRRGSVRCWCCA